MKKLLIISTMICLSLVFNGLYDNAESAPKKQIKLRFVSDYPPPHPGVVGAFKPWIKMIEEKSNNEVKISFFPPNALVPQKETYDSVVSGLVDIGTGFPPNTPGKFPLMTVTQLPFLATGSVATARMIWAMYEKYPGMREQFKDTKLLWLWSGDITQIHSTKRLIKTLDDIKGKKIVGVTPFTAERIRMLGGSPIEVPILDVYMALERGMAEGIVLPYAAVRPLKVVDVAKYHTTINQETAGFYAVMNKDKFNQLPPHIQKLFDETTGEQMAITTSKAIQSAGEASIEWMKENGHQFYTLPESERSKLVELLMPLRERWVEEMEAKGFANARQMLEDAVRFGKQYSE
jgi:TRAP-type C4-dicarboxylate transport system substrate-binding protein